MKLKHKEFIVGIILGGIIFGGITVFADNLFNVIINPFKIKVNGTETFIEGYNINGNSYFKLRDIGECIGFDVDFKEDTIMINTQTAIMESLNEQKAKDEIEVIDEDTIKLSGDLYYYFQRINRNMLKHTLFIPVKNSNEGYTLNLCKKDTSEIILEDIQNILFSEHMYINEKYFNDVILPLDN